jgi:hypothetical protein
VPPSPQSGSTHPVAAHVTPRIADRGAQLNRIRAAAERGRSAEAGGTAHAFRHRVRPAEDGASVFEGRPA